LKVRIFKDAVEFRRWLESNHAAVEEFWVGFYNQRSRQTSMRYPEAVDEALCFGWIDGLRQSVNETTYRVRFTPRKARSNWSAVNIRRVQELKSLGRLAPAGLIAFTKRPEKKLYSYETRPQQFEQAQEKRFTANPEAWKFFRAQAPWYQRTATYWVLSAKKEETQQKRLEILIADSAAGQRLGVVKAKKSK
jgi:uncharacterized protein YdeI (YjbR/CyaY-like superfamily)